MVMATTGWTRNKSAKVLILNTTHVSLQTPHVANPRRPEGDPAGCITILPSDHEVTVRTKAV
jgi:hypothetical protein